MVAAILLVVLIALGLWPLGVAGCLVLLGITWYLAAVTLTVDPTEVCLGQGRGKRGLREIRVRDIVVCEVTRFGWGDAFGSAPAPASNTYVVRAGAGLRHHPQRRRDVEHQHDRSGRRRRAAHRLGRARGCVRWWELARRSATRPS